MPQFIVGDFVKVISPWRIDSHKDSPSTYAIALESQMIEPGTLGVVLDIVPITLWTRVLFAVHGPRWIRGSGNLGVL